MRKYKRITERIRLQIEALYNIAHMRPTQIARKLGYSHVAIIKELKRGFYNHRNSDWTETQKYSAIIAQRSADFQKTTRGAQLKIGNDHQFVKIIEELIVDRKLSPAAALATIKRESIPVKTTICLRTLYHYIDAGFFLHISNKDLPYRGTRKKKNKKVKIAKTPPKGTSIDFRPSDIDSRELFGHWEMDSVIGTNAKGETLLVLTERKTRYELILRSPGKTAAATVSCINRLEKIFGKSNFRRIFKSITCDNGTEFSAYPGIELSPIDNRPRTKVYFCHPYCSSERGSNENQNRIIRRFIHKSTPISSYSDAHIQWTQEYINNLPRNLFAWKTAKDLFISELSALGIIFF